VSRVHTMYSQHNEYPIFGPSEQKDILAAQRGVSQLERTAELFLAHLITKLGAPKPTS
jgi:hypothetical protein